MIFGSMGGAETQVPSYVGLLGQQDHTWEGTVVYFGASAVGRVADLVTRDELSVFQGSKGNGGTIHISRDYCA